MCARLPARRVLQPAIVALCAGLLAPVVTHAQGPGSPNTPAERPSTQGTAPSPDPTLPPPAVPSEGKAPDKADPAPATGPQGPVAVGVEGELVGLALNAITVRNFILQRNFRMALKVAEAVLVRYPNDHEVHMQRARLLFWLGRVDEGEAAAVAVYKADRRNTDALRLVAQIRETRNDPGGAIRAWREAQLRGDGDIRIAVRLVALYLQIGRADLARGQVRPGMELPDELERQLTIAENPWLLQGLVGLSAYQGDLWTRGEATLGYTWSRQLTLNVGLYGEQRDRTVVPIAQIGGAGVTTTLTGYAAYAQLFFEVARISGDVRAFFAPQTGTFLPPIDLWAEGAWHFRRFAVGIWARYANFEISPLWSIGPYVPIFLGRLTLQPGYLFVGRGKGPEGQVGQIGHTVFLRSRWDFDSRDAAFAWLYWGQEVVFTNRTVSAPDESAVSLVVGWDHWFTHRFGIRAMGTVLQQLELGDRWWDVAVAARVRL